MKLRLHFNNSCVTQSFQWPNLKNLSGGLNFSRGLNMVGSTSNSIKCLQDLSRRLI